MVQTGNQSSKVVRIAELTLPSCEVELRGFELLELQGYVELADGGSTSFDLTAEDNRRVPCLGMLAEPSHLLKLKLEAS